MSKPPTLDRIVFKKGKEVTEFDSIQVDFSNDRHFQLTIENSNDVNRYARAFLALAKMIETDLLKSEN